MGHLKRVSLGVTVLLGSAICWLVECKTMKLAFVGVGKMGEAILEGVLNSRLLDATEVGVIGGSSGKAGEVSAKYGVKLIERGDLSKAERVLVCVQPKVFPTVCEWVSKADAGFISIMAGVNLERLSRNLNSKRVVRAMPNLAATIHKSATAVVAHEDANASGDLEFAQALFASVGDVYDIPEPLFNTFTGMVGSGPAYAAIFAEALADGGVRMGLNRKLAIELAGKLLISTGELLLRRVHPGILKDEVASPGGTTIAGIAEIERYTFRSSLIEAVRAATLRGAELGEEK
jgi:pyrroline-5-carboxylate reductase